MKKILIIHHTSGLGGGTKSLIDMAVMLGRKYQAVVCVPSGSKEIIALADRYGVECREIKTPVPSWNVYSGMPGIFSRYFLSRAARFRRNKEFVRELLELEPDAIFYNTIVTSLTAKDVPKHVKNVCMVRETFISRGFMAGFNRIYRRNFEKRFSGTAYIAGHERDYMNLKNPRQLVAPDCLHPHEVTRYPQSEMKAAHGIKAHEFCILFLGGLIQIKGLDVMLGAAERLNIPYRLVIGGNISRESLQTGHLLRHLYNYKYVSFLYRVRKRLEHLTAQGKIILTGYVNDIAPYLCMCDTLVFPSTAAHQPRPGIEAGVFHRSVVISDFEATREYFVDGYNAVTCKPGSPKDLADKITYLYEHPKVNQMLGHNNSIMSREKHDYEKTQQALNDFFDQILKGDECP